MKIWSYQGGGLWADAIKAVTFGGEAHTELEIQPGRFLSSTIDTGPRFAAFDQLVSQDIKDWQIFDLQTTGPEDGIVLAQGNIIVESAGIYGVKPEYNKEGIALNFLPEPLIKQNPTQAFCSQTVVLALQPIGLFLNMVPSLMSPVNVVEWLNSYHASWRQLRSQVTG